MELPYTRAPRAARGARALRARRGASRPPTPATGTRLLEATDAQGLEGVVAKRLDSRYEPGRRGGAWLKVKNTLRQELVIGGWLPGEGRRTERIGALLMGYYEDGQAPLRRAASGPASPRRRWPISPKRLEPLRREHEPVRRRRRSCRATRCSSSRELVAEIEFREWTAERVMRAPSFKGLRDDKPPARSCSSIGEDARGRRAGSRPGLPGGAVRRGRAPPRGGAGASVTDGRRLKITNWDKVLFPRDRLHEGRPDRLLRAHRAGGAAAPARPAADAQALPERRRRAVLLREAVALAPSRVGRRRSGSATSTTRSRRTAPTLIWLANLADVELHTSLSLAAEPRAPDDARVRPRPGRAGRDRRVLRGRRSSCAACSSSWARRASSRRPGSKGLQVYVPLNTPTDYAQTKPFARRVAELLEQRMPELVVSRMTKRLRPARCSSTGARTTPTRRPSPSTRYARASARRSRRR